MARERNHFVYLRYSTPPRALQTDAQAVRDELAARVQIAGGSLFGCWRSLVGLGLGRDEGIALAGFADAQNANSALGPRLDGNGFQVSASELLTASVRPVDDEPPSFSGVYVFRWFDLRESDWPQFLELSDTAWPNMEAVFDVNICGFWKRTGRTSDMTKVLLLTRYADLSVWEASRWWNAPQAAADASMSRFRSRNQLIESTIAYPTLLIPAPA